MQEYGSVGVKASRALTVLDDFRISDLADIAFSCGGLDEREISLSKLEKYFVYAFLDLYYHYHDLIDFK